LARAGSGAVAAGTVAELGADGGFAEPRLAGLGFGTTGGGGGGARNFVNAI